MNNTYIEFKKKRELGDILTDTFGFLRQNIRTIFSILIKTSGIPFIILLVASGYYTYLSADLLDPVSISNGELFNSVNIFFGAILMLLTLAVFYATLFGSIMHIIKEYIENNGVIDKTQVEINFKNSLGKIIGLGLLGSIILFFGLCLCFLPGIYLYVPLNLAFCVMVFKDQGVSESISQSFDVIKNEWWISFATFLIMGIIIWVISFVFGLPAMIYSLSKTFTAASEGSFSDPSEMYDWVFILLNTISSAAQYVLYSITAITAAFIYFNINERKHNTGTLEQIDSLGKSE
ncbi:hypothetical protein [Aquimarina sp. MMG016]|uniref:hypothetical protein n=1 Tax=Aquimarina sp. MMG016 TaxID=2822690 RepID=UPI001B39D118|nr:hypothetical protein [Aquimarina sp. MMG016]MBQ4822403.1 hypothetical protein [Aquimarina sp. MMG016]